jgi:phage-related protein
MSFGLSGLGDLSAKLGSNPYVAGFAAALGAAIGIVGAPFLAANLVAGLGLGAIGGVLAAGIALAAGDPRVKQAGSDLKTQLLDMDTADLEAKVADAQERLNAARKAGNEKAIEQAKEDLATAQTELNKALTFNDKNFSLRDAAQPIIDPLLGALDIFKTALARDIMPELAKSFQVVAPYLPGLADAITQPIVAVLPGFNQFLTQVGGQTMAMFIKELPMIGAALGKFLEILSQDGGSASLALADLMKWLTGFIVEVAYILHYTAKAYSGIRGFITSIPGWVSETVNWLKGGWKSVTEFFTNLGNELASWPGKVGDFFTDIGNAILDRGRIIDEWFRDLPGRIGEFIESIPGRVKAGLSQLFDVVTFSIGLALGSVTRFFLDLPGRAQDGLLGLRDLALSYLGMLKDGAIWAVQTTVDTLVFLFMDLPARASTAVSNLWPVVSGAFWAVVHGIRDAGSAMWHGLIGWLERLPGAAGNAAHNTRNSILGVFSGAAGWLYHAGQDIMRGVADGIQSMAGWVADLARRAANNIISGFRKALGIASPSKVAAEKIGEPVVQGVMAPIEQSAPRIRGAIERAVPDMVPSAGGAREVKPAAGDLYATIPIVVDLGDEKITKVVKTVIRRAPTEVAAANEAGARRRDFAFSGRAGT